MSALVAAQRAIQGRQAGWRPLAAALPGEPVRLIQEALSAMKAREQARLDRVLGDAREHHEVLAREAIWAQDGLQLGRVAGEAVHGEVIRDVATTSSVSISAGPPTTEADVIELFERAAAARGGYPLVWQTDNGGPYTSAYVEHYLRRRRVIHLLSRPHTPTDNPCAERGIGELRGESGLSASTPLSTAHEALAALERARGKLDQGRRRASRGYRTAAQLDHDLPRAEQRIDRERFYAQACTAIAKAVQDAPDARAARTREREAIWEVLERHGLVRRWRGRQAPPAPQRRGEIAARMDP